VISPIPGCDIIVYECIQFTYLMDIRIIEGQNHNLPFITYKLYLNAVHKSHTINWIIINNHFFSIVYFGLGNTSIIILLDDKLLKSLINIRKKRFVHEIKITLNLYLFCMT